MENKGDIEKSARSKLGSFKMEPPEGAWNALDAELDKKQAILMTKKANRFKMLSVALVLLLVSFVSFYYLTPSKNAAHTSEVSDKQITLAHAKPLPGNDTDMNTESDTGNSEKPAGRNLHKSISNQNKNKTIADYQSTNNDYKKLITEKITLKSKQEYIAPDGNGNSNNVKGIIQNNADHPIHLTNEVSAISISNSETLSKAPDSNDAETVNSNVIVKTATSITGLLDKEDTVTKSRISISLFYSPDYSWTKLKDNTSDNVDDAAMYNNRENSEFSYTAGITLQYHLNNSWSFVSGITYSTLAKSITLQTMYAHANSDNEMHFMYPTSNGMIEMPFDNAHPAMHEGDSINTGADGRQLIKFINVPLMVRVQATKKKFTWYANGGFSVNFIVQEKAKIKMENTEMNILNHIQGLNKMNYGFLFGAGVQYRIFNSMDLFTEPVFRGSFTSITHDAPVKSYPYSLGLKTGILFRF